MQKSTFGGVLSIIAGALALVGALVLFYFARISPSLSKTGENIDFGVTMWSFLGVIGLIIGILSIAGGIFALQRKMWGIALAGAVLSLFAFLPLGIAAVILTAMGRSEFTCNEAEI